VSTLAAKGHSGHPGHPRHHRRRRAAALLTLAAVLAAGAALDRLPGLDNEKAPSTATQAKAPNPPKGPHAAEVQSLFQQAVVMLHARRYEHAVVALHRVLQMQPALVEAHVNMGFALIGMARTREARDFFEGAIALSPRQANAYYGLALAHEALGDLALATGAMRSYVHLSRDERPEHLARARAALWEWERQRKENPARR
jgi:tetratricopeptide (TPR) repeat protein